MLSHLKRKRQVEAGRDSQRQAEAGRGRQRQAEAGGGRLLLFKKGALEVQRLVNIKSEQLTRTFKVLAFA